MPELSYDNSSGGDGGLLHGSGDELMEGCCCDGVTYYQFRSCGSGLLVDAFVLSTAAPFVPDAMTPWTIFSNDLQTCLYTEGDTDTPGTVLAHYRTISACANPVCSLVPPDPVDPPTESDCECPPDSGNFVADQVIATINVTTKVCDGDASRTTVETTMPIVALLTYDGGCGWSGYAYFEFSIYESPFNCVDGTGFEMALLITVSLDTSTETWGGAVASAANYYRKSDGTSFAGPVTIFTNETGAVGDCTGATLDNEIVDDTGGDLGWGGTMVIAAVDLPP